MTLFSLPPEDRIDPRDRGIDGLLGQQLELSLSKRFYDRCDREAQALLDACEWYLTNTASALTLVIICEERSVNWRVLNNIDLLGNYLASLSSTAKIQVYPVQGMGEPLLLRVDEISVYQDLFQNKGDPP
jgi:hypothetical protein